MSRTLLILVATLAPSADALSTTKAIMTRHHERTAALPPKCKPNADPNQIIVCSEDANRHRLPLPVDRSEREGPRLASGDIPAASAKRVYTGGCATAASPDRVCGGGISLLSAVPLLYMSVVKIIDPEVEFGPPPPVPDQFRRKP